MKNIYKIFLLPLVFFAFASCEKVADLPFYKNGTAPVLTSSATSIASLPADSSKPALTLSWTYPAYATDSAGMKYVIEFDSSGRNFSKATSVIVKGSLSKTFTAKDLNTILLSYGFAFGTAYDMDVRVISSYANNNERLTSNTIKIKMTPYKVPPKVPLSSSGRLFLVGDATQGGWNNPVPVPSQEFAKLDETTWGGIFQLNAGKQYLILPVNGDWSNKYAVANNNVAGLNLGGDFGFNLNDNFPGPTVAGLYKIIVDFQNGKFTVTPYANILPKDLFIVGDATAGGWNNPVPVPSQKLTRLNSSVWEIILPLIGGKEYLLLPVNGDWSHKFAVANKSVAGLSSGGTFGYDLNDNFPAPAVSGNYKITVNFTTGKFTVQ